MQSDTSNDPLSAVGNEVVLPSAASFGGFVQVRTAPVPRSGSGCGLGVTHDIRSNLEATSTMTSEVQYAR